MGCWPCLGILAACLLSLSGAAVQGPHHEYATELMRQAMAAFHVSTPSGLYVQHNISLQQQLSGSGFHRELQFHITHARMPASAGEMSQSNSHSVVQQQQEPFDCHPVQYSASRQHALSCQLALLQPLPSDVYADMDQLENSAAANGGFHVQLFGTADAERTEVECRPTVLLLRVNATIAWLSSVGSRSGGSRRVSGESGDVTAEDGDSKGAALPRDATCTGGGSDTAGQFTGQCSNEAGTQGHEHQPAFTGCHGKPVDSIRVLTIPVHARYPAPVSRHIGSLSTFLPSPVSIVALPPARLLVQCGEGQSWQEVVQPAESSANEWSVPTGNVQHAALVNVVTASAYIIAAVAVVYTAYTKSLKNVLPG